MVNANLEASTQHGVDDTRDRHWIGAALALAVTGWGANQFAPLIVVYAARQHLSTALLNGIFGLYALGLIPALHIGGRLSDGRGRRRVVLTGLAVSLLGTAVLICGGSEPAVLATGRFISGVASGLVFSSGTAWMKDLSRQPVDTSRGPRRSTIAMTIGFAAGPFISGVCAQWLPAPTVLPYLPHLVLLVIAGIFVHGTPDPRRQNELPLISASHNENNERRKRLVRMHFLLILAPFAPWVFGTAAIALAYLPSQVATAVTGHAAAFSAVATGLTAVTGILVQPLVKVVNRPASARLLILSMTVVIISMMFGAWAVYEKRPLLVVLACALLGAAYGFTQFCGLAEVQAIADPRSLGRETAMYQMISYLGFAFPFLLSISRSQLNLSPATLLCITAGIAVVVTAWLTIVTRTFTHRRIIT